MYSSILLFLNIGGQEMIFIFVIALFLFGGKKLPELARGLGKGLREFKDASETIKRDINDQINDFEKDVEKKSAPKAIAENSSTPASSDASVVAESERPSSEEAANADDPTGSSAEAAATKDYSDPTLDPNYNPEYDGFYQPNYDYSVHSDEATSASATETPEPADSTEPLKNTEDPNSKTE
ncbi:Sec-independent protein translocase subunit TatA/TatB [Albibacterium bauzanense]|uniref:Sec-independent protein translocase protein TatA n=1 Tax=Albibacterium bauzanense TaxID=653929 RepID=A0A4R1LZK3_9SPHI|nr:twin-arginine translocase TatA/TatE family subunit [Albibacterium bauzanense]TCK85018.1 sec-independent protein translocase protein TatA [Albibacterium bauzanense]